MIALSGARPEILQQCPTERGKFDGIGGAVLTTSVLAAASMAFALHSALGVHLVFAIPVSLLWGLAIMSLDRWLVTTLQPDGPRRWRLAVPRILMAVLLGVVVSTPLVLQIFKSEIDAQIVEIRQARANAFVERQGKEAVGQEVARLRARVSELRNIIASGGDLPADPAKDPKVKSLTAEHDEQQKLAAKHYKEWQCQLYGGPTCPRKGPGVLAKASETAYKKARSRVDALNRDIDARKSELKATDQEAKQGRLDAANTELPTTEALLKAALQRQGNLQAAFDEENESVNGLLIRLQALNEVSGSDFTLGAARVVLFLLFLLIECLPVMVKLMQRPGNYDRLLQLAVDREYREAKGAYNAFGSSPAHHADAPRTGRDLSAIWKRPPPPRQEPLDEPVSHERAEPETLVTEQLPREPAHSPLEDERLRSMPDARPVRVAEPLAPGTRFELFPEDE
ncbi:hypothetical protein Ssi02_08180 [Sinosporangium siamense]|uniref:DUF4407 domain-containing protein n=1 Tax=Sinosporangium siamense TaxID=1367973 RepID=A0A919V652_9ACTN|nr:hypothetical protein Ssi02_08180 [Sinosporangium siamense]